MNMLQPIPVIWLVYNSGVASGNKLGQSWDKKTQKLLRKSKSILGYNMHGSSSTIAECLRFYSR